MIDRRQLFAAAAASTTLGFASRTSAQTPAPSADVVTALDALRADRNSTGGIMVAVRGGRPVAVYPWGKASLPFDVPVTERTLFHLGSNGKFMTALAVAQLAEAGALSFDDPLGKHLPDLPADMGRMTISGLLHHTTGLLDYPETLPDWDRPQTREVVIAAMKDQPLLFQPGAAWSYSNTNYLVLGWLIETLSGQTYADYIQTRVFGPAGAPTARADASQQIVPNRAEPYSFTSEGLRHAVRMEDGLSRAADGGLLFSALDVAPWRAALDGNRLVSAQTMARLLAPARLISGRLAPYGCGVFLDRARGAPWLRHTGGVPGFVSSWMTWPEADLSILLMMNSDGLNMPRYDRMVLTLAEALQPGVTWLDQPPEGDGSDVRTRRLRALLERPADAPVPDGLLAEEKAWLPAARLPRVNGLVELVPLEHWRIGDTAAEGEFVRYRLTLPAGVGDVLVGWTPDDRIYSI